MAKLFEVAQSVQLDLPLEKGLENIAYALRSITPFQAIKIYVINSDGILLSPIAAIGLDESEREVFEKSQVPWVELQGLLEDAFGLGKAYFIPVECQAEAEGAYFPKLIPCDERGSNPNRSFSWQAGDLFVLPLYSSGGHVLGAIQMDKPRDNLRPDRSLSTSLEVIAVQAA